MYEHLARCHQTRARAVQGLQVEPILALQLDEAHGRPRSRLGDPRRIVIIVLLCTDVGADILRRHQSDLMPLRSEETADVMRSAARLHSNRASRSEEHTSELQSLMRISYDVFCLKTIKTE